MANWLESRSGAGGGLFDMIREFDDWFRSGAVAPLSGRIAGLPSSSFDIEETESAYRLLVDLPGVRPEDVDIQAQGQQLLIMAERRSREDQGSSSRRESMRYQRSFTLPDGIDADAIEASLEHGVLTLELPKSKRVSPKRIEIRGVERGEGASRLQESGEGKRGKKEESSERVSESRSTAQSESRQPRH